MTLRKNFSDYSNDDIENIVQLYQSGTSFSEIGRILKNKRII